MMDFVDLNEFSDIVHDVLEVEYYEKEHVSVLKGKLVLADSSLLYIREVRKEKNLIAYSYYWMRTDHSIIMGWDNAPHHSEIKTHPHHRHIGSEVIASKETKLTDVLHYIRKSLC
ncbi:MAG: hypothetical protein GWP06_13860 [Actinobacteria bacterium]|nr:hypothetical protein [Actinomycetota bacterium]